ncbi:MAG TPA: acyl carrier protein [Anaeromyxobacter sp.]
MDMRQQVKRFVIDNFYLDASEVADDTLLVTGGLVDSTGVLEVVAFLETEFNMRIADDETTPENLDSVERIVAFVARKTGRSAA